MISRMARAVRNEYFQMRVFSDEEIAYARSHVEPPLHFASSFAAKEAFAKASGLGIFGVGLAASWVRRTKEGPVMMPAPEVSAKLGEFRCWLSLSHEGDYALAFVVLERDR
jgi:holo-[acyl-carrier protein] synthase